LLLVLLLLPGWLRAQSVVFEPGPFAEVLRRAKAARKMVFMHFSDPRTKYGQHAETVLARPETPGLLNGWALSYRVDLGEPGADGELVAKYGPKLQAGGVFLDGDGRLLHRYDGIRAFGLQWDVQRAWNEFDDYKPLSVWEQEYPRHRRDPEFLYGYLRKRQRTSRPDDGTVLNEYLRCATPAQLTADYTLDLVLTSDFDATSRAFELLLQYRDRAAEPHGLRGELLVWAALRQALRRSVARAAAANRPGQFREALAIHERLRRISPYVTNWSDAYLELWYLAFNQSLGPRNPKFESRARTYLEAHVMGLDPEAIRRRDSATFAQFRQPYLRGERDSTQDEPGYRSQCQFWRNPLARRYADELTFAAEQLFYKAPDRAQTALVTALGWAGRAAELDLAAGRLSLYAHLLERTGRPAEGARIMQRAMAQARREGASPPTLSRLEREATRMRDGTPSTGTGSSLQQFFQSLARP
jgi:hypothetical protein